MPQEDQPIVRTPLRHVYNRTVSHSQILWMFQKARCVHGGRVV